MKYRSVPIVDVCLLIDVISAIIIGTGQTGLVWGLLLIVLSAPLILFPPALLPLIFVSSWSISFGVAFIAGYFYYFAVFLLSLLLNRSCFKLIKKISVVECLLILFCAWTMFVGLRSVSGDLLLSLKVCLFMIPALCMFHLKIKGMGYAMEVVYIIAALFSILFFCRALIDPYYITIEGHYTIKTSLTVIKDLNTNTAAQIVVINFLIVFVMSLRRASIPGIVIACLNLYPIFAMGSRTSFFTLVFLSALYLLLTRMKLKTRLTLLSIIAVLLLAVVVISSGQEAMERLNLMSFVDDQGSGRFINWYFFFKEIVPSHWLNGIGVSKLNYEYLGYEFDADNLYVDLLCETGVAGLVLFLSFFVLLSHKLYKCREKNKVLDASWMILIAFFLLGLGETVFDAPLFWFTVMYGVAGITKSTR